MKKVCYTRYPHGDLAPMVEQHVCNVTAIGSNPMFSTYYYLYMRNCSKCDEEKLSHSTYCREHYREYQRNWVRDRKKEFYRDKQCLHCGSKENLELDHIDPSTKVSHSIWSWSEGKRLKEISKCQVLCHACHILKSRSNGDLSGAIGENQWSAKLTAKDVKDIRLRFKNGEKAFNLALEYNIGRSYIYRIIKKLKWKHI